jgi:hypothetical protein
MIHVGPSGLALDFDLEPRPDGRGYINPALAGRERPGGVILTDRAM